MDRRAVFLDKDGTLVENIPYNVDPSRIRLGPGAAEGLARLHAAGFLLIVVSNQSGVARGLFQEVALTAVRDRLIELLAGLGVPLGGFHYCPHHPQGPVARYAIACSCRKPEPGMILTAAREHSVSVSDSWMVGDILDDVEAGRRAGCRTVLLDTGHETLWRRSAIRRPDFVAGDLDEAARLIVAHSEP
jgi:histidinol-phosphate phosphatase family protein